MISPSRDLYGIHSFTAYNLKTGKPYGTLKALLSSSLSFSGELVERTGGSSMYPLAVEQSKIAAEGTLKFNEYPDWVFEVFAGKKPVQSLASETGAVAGFENKKGSSIKSSTTGIASVSIKSGETANLKFGKYVIEATSTSAVKVYALTDIDLDRGTKAEMKDDQGAIVDAALTVTTGAAVAVPGFGIELMGGSSSPAFQVGDTAVFEVHPPYDRLSKVTIGAPTDVVPEIGALIVAQKAGDGRIAVIDVFKCKGFGLPLGFEEKKFSEAEVKLKVLFDPFRQGVAEINFISPK